MFFWLLLADEMARILIFDVVGVKFSQAGMVFGVKIPSAKTIPGVEGAVRL